MSDADPNTLIGTVLDGKYAIESYVAKGGFGVVYRGQHLRLHKPLAIKVLRLKDDLPAEVARLIREFEEEARLVSGLDHPAIVRVVDVGFMAVPPVGEVPWMVAEWVEGATLASDLKDRRGRGGRSPAECLGLLKPVFEALVYAHQMGVVHRDIKPANLMFTGADPDGSAALSVGAPPLKLLDFGIAKVMGPEETPTTGQTATRSAWISFSIKYGAPEQFSGSRTGPWTDVHAMALILTEMLTDRPPYEGREAMDFHLEALSLRRPTPGRFGVDVGAWEPVLAKALALRPSERYTAMWDFLAALEAEVPSSPGQPRPRGDVVSEAPEASESSPAGTLRPVAHTSARPAPLKRLAGVAVLIGAAAVAGLGITIRNVRRTTQALANDPAARGAPPSGADLATVAPGAVQSARPSASPRETGESSRDAEAAPAAPPDAGEALVVRGPAVRDGAHANAHPRRHREAREGRAPSPADARVSPAAVAPPAAATPGDDLQPVNAYHLGVPRPHEGRSPE